MSVELFIEEFKNVKFNPQQTHYLFKNALTTLPKIEAFKEYIEFSKTEGNFRSDSEGMYILHTDPVKHDLNKFLEIQKLINPEIVFNAPEIQKQATQEEVEYFNKFGVNFSCTCHLQNVPVDLICFTVFLVQYYLVVQLRDIIVLEIF